MRRRLFIGLLGAGIAVLFGQVAEKQNATKGNEVQDASSVRRAAEKTFAEGKEVYLYGLTPNPIVDDALGTWRCSVRFLRSKTAKVPLRETRMRIRAWNELVGIVYGPRTLSITGEYEGTIAFDVRWEVWQVGGGVSRGPAELALYEPTGDVSNYTLSPLENRKLPSKGDVSNMLRLSLERKSK